MKSKDIKQNIEKYQNTILECQFAISELQNSCPHESTYEKDGKDCCLDCKSEFPKKVNSEEYYGECKYFQICTQCVDGICNCTMANTTVKQYFNRK